MYASGAETSNWRKYDPREKTEHTSVSQSLSWRDPNFKYERVSKSRNWRNDDSNNEEVPSIREISNYDRYDRLNSSEDSQAKLSTFAKNRDKLKVGNWTLTCASDIMLQNGLTEVEHVRNCVKELYEQHSELFSTSSYSEFKGIRGEIKINCYITNGEDKAHVAKVADILMDKIGIYPYCFYYFRNKKTAYMRTCEGEFYEF